MTEPSTQDEQGKTKQVLQGNWGQPLHSQHPFQPLGVGGSYAPGAPFAPPQSASAQVSSMSTKNTAVLGNLSLLAISFSLMLLGVFTFLGGFLLGMWFATPPKASFPTSVGNVPTLGLFPLPQYISASRAPLAGKIVQGLAENAGSATQGAITGFTVPGVPDTFTPFVATNQSALGQQTGSKVQEQISQHINPALSSKTRHSSSSNSKEESQSYKAPLSQAPRRDTSTLLATSPHKGTLPTSVSLPSPKSPSQENEGVYTVQLGVYAAKDNAEALVNHLQALNYTSHIDEGKSHEGNTVYYVHSGLYKDYNTAVDAASQFAAQNIPGAIVVKLSTSNKSTS